MTKKQEQLMICPKAKECKETFKDECTHVHPHEKIIEPIYKACEESCFYEGCTCIPVEPQPATCPDCGHPVSEHFDAVEGLAYFRAKGCRHFEGSIIGGCGCQNTPADQPEKHCTLPDGHIMAGGLCQHCPQTTEGCQYWGNEQPTPTMPLREQEQLYGWDLDKRLDDFKTIAERLEDENYHSRAKAVLYLIERCKRAEAHDSAIAAQAVKEFAEKVIIWIETEIDDRRAYRTRLTLEEVSAHIRAMAEGKE